MLPQTQRCSLLLAGRPKTSSHKNQATHSGRQGRQTKTALQDLGSSPESSNGLPPHPAVAICRSSFYVSLCCSMPSASHADDSRRKPWLWARYPRRRFAKGSLNALAARTDVVRPCLSSRICPSRGAEIAAATSLAAVAPLHREPQLRHANFTAFCESVSPSFA